MTMQVLDTPGSGRPDAALDRDGPDDARRGRRSGTGRRPIGRPCLWATRGTCRVTGSAPPRSDRTAAPVIYHAAAALPHDNRERATNDLRDQLRIMAGAAGAMPDWTTLVVTGPTQMDGAPAPTRFEWTASVAIPGGSVLDALPDPDALLTAWTAEDGTMPFPAESSLRRRHTESRPRGRHLRALGAIRRLRAWLPSVGSSHPWPSGTVSCRTLRRTTAIAGSTSSRSSA